jgi:large subunit ribosomal protein L5
MAQDESNSDDEAKKAAAEAKKKERAEKAAAKGLAGAKKKSTEPVGPAPTYKREGLPRLRKVYNDTIQPAMMKEFGYSTVMQVPRIVKISVNMGLGKAKEEPKMIDNGVEELKLITGQSPVVSRAKKDIAVFKLRKGQKIGVMVTLRKERMWEFLDRLLSIALPRVRDFRGVSARGFDGRGNFTMGVREQIIFPEIEYDKIDSIKGMNISIVTTANTDAEGRALLTHLGMPFRQAPPPATTGAAA